MCDITANPWFSFIAFILAIIAAFAGVIQRDNLKEEAIKRGFAEWHVLGQDRTEFRWRETK